MAFGTNELRNYVYLRGLLDSFEKRVLEYCSSPTEAEERFNRVKVIRDVLTGSIDLPSEVSVSALSVPPSMSAEPVEDDYPNCDENERCDGAACVPRNVMSGWPELNDPESWGA
jgi:hypothetical protein